MRSVDRLRNFNRPDYLRFRILGPSCTPLARALPDLQLHWQKQDLPDLPTNVRRAGATVRKRILLVEDDQHSRNGLQASLRADGHGVEAVSDGWQGFQKIKEGVFDLAIVDLDLPPVLGVLVTGWDVVRILRAYSPDIPIIMVSAQEDGAIQRLLKRFRISAFMVKPIDLAGVKAFVRALDQPMAKVGVADCGVY